MLEELKKRLAALPEQRLRARQAGRFKALREKAAKSRAQAEEALAAAQNATKVVNDPGYLEVIKQVRKARRRAETLRTKIEGNAEVVAGSDTDKSFGALGEHTEKALRLCQNLWRQIIDKKLRGRAELASVVQRLVPGDGPQFRSTVDQLTRERDRLPVSAEDAQRAAQLLERFDVLIGRLRLEGPAGEFLQAVATERGAAATQLLDPEVRKFLDDYKLWSIFAVKMA